MSGQGNVLTQLSQELTVLIAEAVGIAPCHYERAEHVACSDQRRGNQRMQPASGEVLQEGGLRRADVRLVNELAVGAARQAILINRNLGVFGKYQLLCQRGALRS